MCILPLCPFSLLLLLLFSLPFYLTLSFLCLCLFSSLLLFLLSLLIFITWSWERWMGRSYITGFVSLQVTGLGYMYNEMSFKTWGAGPRLFGHPLVFLAALLFIYIPLLQFLFSQRFFSNLSYCPNQKNLHFWPNNMYFKVTFLSISNSKLLLCLTTFSRVSKTASFSLNLLPVVELLQEETAWTALLRLCTW